MRKNKLEIFSQKCIRLLRLVFAIESRTIKCGHDISLLGAYPLSDLARISKADLALSLHYLNRLAGHHVRPSQTPTYRE